MKLTIGFKCPDAVDFAVKEAFANAEVDPDSGEKMIDGMTEEDVKEKLAHWIGFGEYVSIEVMVDVMGSHASVLPTKKGR